MLLKHGDVGRLTHALHQHFLHGSASGIGHVDDAALRVTALARQVNMAVFLREFHAQLLQPLHGFGRVLDGEHGGG